MPRHRAGAAGGDEAVSKGERFRVEPVTENDARELDLFERYLRHRAADRTKTDREHYADVYGEVIYPLPVAK